MDTSIEWLRKILINVNQQLIFVINLPLKEYLLF